MAPCKPKEPRKPGPEPVDENGEDRWIWAEMLGDDVWPVSARATERVDSGSELSMDDDELARWFDAWSERYPVQADDCLVPLAGAATFPPASWSIVIDWKFSSDRRRRANARHVLQESEAPRLEDLSAAAFHSRDDMNALRILCTVKYVGPALASALLAAQNPDRFTVMDARALKSLRPGCLAELGPGPEDATVGEWSTYLATCRDLARRSRRALRTVDRALWMSEGHREMPT
jgi:hypothetical protein